MQVGDRVFLTEYPPACEGDERTRNVWGTVLEVVPWGQSIYVELDSWPETDYRPFCLYYPQSAVNEFVNACQEVLNDHRF